jgi:hypothetical protein
MASSRSTSCVPTWMIRGGRHSTNDSGMGQPFDLLSGSRRQSAEPVQQAIAMTSSAHSRTTCVERSSTGRGRSEAESICSQCSMSARYGDHHGLPPRRLMSSSRVTPYV